MTDTLRRCRVQPHALRLCQQQCEQILLRQVQVEAAEASSASPPSARRAQAAAVLVQHCEHDACRAALVTDPPHDPGHRRAGPGPGAATGCSCGRRPPSSGMSWSSFSSADLAGHEHQRETRQRVVVPTQTVPPRSPAGAARRRSVALTSRNSDSCARSPHGVSRCQPAEVVRARLSAIFTVCGRALPA